MLLSVCADTVLALAGQGTFGTVLTVWDAKHREEVALKMVRAVRRYSESARVERDILLRLREADPDRASYGRPATQRVCGHPSACVVVDFLCVFACV